ncbi:MAG: TonB family protein [Bacteroidota bacterium]
MRFVLLLAVASVATVATAQPTFRLAQPTLTVDDRPLAVSGTPLVQRPFGLLAITLPGTGTFWVSDRPFIGSTRAGLFDEDGLFFHAGGRSLQLLSRNRILSTEGPVSAYARFDAAPAGRTGGVARLAVADAADGRGMRSTIRSSPSRGTARGPGASSYEPARRSARSRDLNRRADRPAARYLRDTRARRLARDAERAVADRQRLAQERDRVAALRAERQRNRPAQVPSGAFQSLRIERDQLARDRDRLVVERDQLSAALARAEADRDQLAIQFSQLRARAEDAEARASRARRGAMDAERVEADLISLRAERSALRAEIESRDRAIATLTAETRNRADRLPSLEADLATARRQLAEAIAARDRALVDRDVAYAQRDQAISERDQARAERDAAVADADRLRVAQDQPGLASGLDLDAEREALARDRALLDADRRALAAEREALDASARAPENRDDALAERRDLIAELAATQAEREALLAERSALVAERDRLAAALAAEGSEVAASPGTTIRTPPGPEGAFAFLPGFDFSRLQNPDVVRRRLDEAQYPRWATVGRIEGDVLVLFQTDRTGRVIRTAVPTPLGGGLDALAEEIVREMTFVAPTVDGQATGLRSQVIVRFTL